MNRGLLLLVLCAPLTEVAAQESSITGKVMDGSHPVAGAVVRLQATAVHATTDEQGAFTLDLAGQVTWPWARVTVFAPGYFIAGPFLLQRGQRDAVLRLQPHGVADDGNYAWLSGFASEGQDGNCQRCHSQAGLSLPFDEWQADAHSGSAKNRRFLSMYNGTDLSGRNQSPPTRFLDHKDYGRIPLPPDPEQPYYGPGFRLDVSDRAGNCAACHAPAAAIDTPYDTDPNHLGGVGLEGVGCDFCHKIWNVRLQTSTGLPYPNTPGVLSFEFRRPGRGKQFFAGPLDDVAPGEDTYSPLQNESRICAPCHVADFWGTRIYNSYGEWAESPYANPVGGQTCQDCHMPRRGANYIASPQKGGLWRDAKSVYSHRMPGADDAALLRDTASLAMRTIVMGRVLRVDVRVTNAKAGHHIPTDHPARNMLLVVSASDARGERLTLDTGPMIPEWGGVGSDPADYGGRPGRGYAKVLEELWTQVTPSAAYWNPTVVRSDTRIPALGSDVSQYEFLLPSAGGPVRVEARLIFRRAFRALMKQKAWNVPDIVMGQVEAEVSVLPEPRN